jgi:hypothetical protein
MPRVPLDLYAEVETAGGARYRWDANQAPGSRLQNFSFRTKIGEGFSDASGQLARRIDFDYPDLNLVDTVTVVGADGSVAYEGRLAATPLSLDEKHSVGVTLAGWMSHAKDKKFREIYVDRDLGGWGGMSVGRRAAVITSNAMPITDGSRKDDSSNNEASIVTSFTGPWIAPYTPIAEAWYDAGPTARIGKIVYSWKRETPALVDNTNTGWAWQVLTATDDVGTSFTTTGSLRAAGPVANAVYFPSAYNRYAFLQFNYGTTPGGGSVEYSIAWSKLAIYGTHGLDNPTGQPGEPGGVYASDVMRHIAGQHCPHLDTSGVQDTSYVIQHLAFKDRTYPFDAWLEINKFHQWHLGVWDNKTLHFRPYDLTDYTWEVRTDDPGTTFEAQGQSTEDFYNGIVVTYTNLVTGIEGELTPLTNPELKDTDPANPWNMHGVDHWDEIQLSTPALAADAAQLGRMALAERNRPKAPGTITVRGYIRDRQGNEQPVWKVRAGDTISATNFFDGIHLITETDYSDADKSLRVAVDTPFQLLEAYLDRVGNALQARGLT